MRFWKKRLQRVAAMVCSVALAASMMPTAVFAVESEATTPTPEPTSIVETTPEPSESPVNTDATVTTPAPGTGTGSTSAPEATPAGNTDDTTDDTKPVESPEPSGEPTDDTTESGEEGTETTDSTTVPSEENVEQQVSVPQTLAAAPTADGEPETQAAGNNIYENPEKGIYITFEDTGGSVPRTVHFIITENGNTLQTVDVEGFRVLGNDVTIIAPGYRVSTSLDGEGGFTPKGGNLYWLLPTSEDCTAHIDLVSVKDGDNVSLGDYGTFSWEKANADTDQYERNVTIYVDGVAQQETYTVYTPENLTNTGTNDQFWFTPNVDKYNTDYQIKTDGDITGLTLGNTPGYVDFSVYLTTKCPCGRTWCECPGGGCGCIEECPCDQCNPQQAENEIRTPYGSIEYTEDLEDGYKLTVELYVNGQLRETVKGKDGNPLRISAGVIDGLNFEPTDGYYYYYDTNSYDIDTAHGGIWHPRTGMVTIVPGDGAKDYDNVLKIYLWTFQNHSKLDVERRVDVGDKVKGYTISYKAYNPETKQYETFTYEATSFLVAQPQMVPTNTEITITPICESPYEVDHWSTADAYSAVTLRGERSQQGTNAYGNKVYLTVGNTTYISMTLYIESLREVKVPEDDELINNEPDDPDAPPYFKDNVAVVVDCVNESAQHKSESFKLMADRFTVSELKGDSASGYYAEVTITNPQAYVDTYNAIYPNYTHTLSESQDKLVITLRWVVENKESVWKADGPATIKVTCDDEGEDDDDKYKPGETIKIKVVLDGDDVTADWENYIALAGATGTKEFEYEYNTEDKTIHCDYVYETYNCADIKIDSVTENYALQAVQATLVYGDKTKNGSEGITAAKLDNVQGGSDVIIYLATEYSVEYYVDNNTTPSPVYADNADYSVDKTEVEAGGQVPDNNMPNVDKEYDKDGMQTGYLVTWKASPINSTITLQQNTDLNAWYPKWNTTEDTVDGTKLGTTVGLAAILANKNNYTVDGNVIKFFGETAAPEAIVQKSYSVKRDGAEITVDANNKLKVGDVITYTITVTNNGNVDLSDLMVTDTFTGKGSLTFGSDGKGAITTTNEGFTWKPGETVAPNGSVELTYTYIVVEDDLDSTITNTAAVSGGDVPEAEDEENIPVEDRNPDAQVTKTLTKILRNGQEIAVAADTGLKVGDEITYEIKVENTGNVALSDLTVTDEFSGYAEPGVVEENGTQVTGVTWQKGETETDPNWTLTITDIDLVVGEEKTYTYTYTVNQADAGKNLTNTAAVTGGGTDPDDDKAEDERPVKDDGDITLQPADITIYMGGYDGYEAVVGDDGKTHESNTLPEPGFYITLPETVQKALSEAGHSGGTAADLSNMITVTATTNSGEDRSWILKKYSEGESTALITDDDGNSQEHFLYRIEPTGVNQPAIRVVFTNPETGEQITSDVFDPTTALYDSYEMALYTGDVNVEAISLQITVKDKTFYCGYDAQNSKSGKLTVRYTSSAATTTMAVSNLDAEVAEEPNAFYAQFANAEQKFYINEQDTLQGTDKTGVEVGQDNVYLLADNVIESEGLAEMQERAQQAAGFENTGAFAKYFDLVDIRNGNAWLTPQDGTEVKVYWPYPAGTDKNTEFNLYHFVDLDREMLVAEAENEVANSDMDPVTIEKTETGITFKTSSFSPFVLVWDNTQPSGGGEDKPSGGDNGNNDNNNNNTNTNNQTTTVNVANQAAAPAAAPAAVSVPQTSDDMPIGALTAAAVAAAAALVGLLVVRKRRQK